MPSTRHLLQTATGITALAFALPAAAQDGMPALPELPPVGASAMNERAVGTVTRTTTINGPMTQAEIDALPPEYRSLPVGQEITTTRVDENGVETITRTRRIAGRAPDDAYYNAGPGPQGTTYASYAPMTLDRESWIEECERRTDGRDRDSTGTIIGGLLGAIGGGILGNRVWDSERLAGTLIGGGVGGIAGALIGSLFNGGRKDDLYDCEAALDTYLDRYGRSGSPRLASRVIAAPPPVAYPGYPAYTYGYGQPSYPAPSYYQPAQTMVMVPVTTYQQQRVIVRENVSEETYEVPGSARTIPAARPVMAPAPAPSPKMIKN